jgi:phage shock protein PspC (stress-responsive transcriptional regulator)
MEQTTPPAGGPNLPPAPAPGATGPGFFDSVRRTGLVRTQDRWIGGVSGGVARRFGIDPLLVRGILGVTVLLGGAGLVLYGIAWALLPEEADGRIHLQETIQGRFDAALLGALALVVVGLNRGDGWFGWWDERGLGWVNGLLWLAALVAVVALLVGAGNQRRAQRAEVAATPTTTWAAAPPAPPAPGGRSVPHPGYGAVPYASAGAPPAPSWAGDPAATGGVPPAGAVPPGAVQASGAAAGPVPPPYGASGVPGAGPSGATAYRPAQPPFPPPPPRPVKPRVQGPGVGAVGTVVGLTLLALATLLIIEREGDLGGLSVGLTTLGIGVVLAGLGIMVSGLRGRSSGTLGFLAVVGIILSVPAALVPAADDRFGFPDGPNRFSVSTGEPWRPATVAEAERGLSAGFGDVQVDLTDVPLGGGVVEVPISMSGGDMEVVVPDDVAVTADIALTAGQVTWDVDGRTGVAGFSGGRSETYQSDEAADGDVELAVRIRAGAGEVRVVEED